MEQEDYSKIYEYESMGKVYADEKACISLTSWKARINTVAKTLYSLIKMCPGFHIVLVLSKDEFPLMEKELPDNLMLFVENKLIELFWIRPNLKSFKKVLFTMDKYRTVPVISADDGCLYTYNYAQELYDRWEKNQISIISEYNAGICGYSWGGGGHGLLFPPYCFLDRGIKSLNSNIIKTNHDDAFFGVLAKTLGIKFTFLHRYCENTKTFIDISWHGLYNDKKFTDSSCKLIQKEINQIL